MMKKKISGRIFGIAMVFIIVASMCGIMPTPVSAATFSPGDEVRVINTLSVGLVVRDLGSDVNSGHQTFHATRRPS